MVRVVFCALISFVFVDAEGMNLTLYSRTHAGSDMAYLNEVKAKTNEEAVNLLIECAKSVTENSNNEASGILLEMCKKNQVGRNLVDVLVTETHPYAECAKSLDSFMREVDGATDQKDRKDMILKFLTVLSYGKSNSSSLIAIWNGIEAILDELKIKPKTLNSWKGITPGFSDIGVQSNGITTEDFIVQNWGRLRSGLCAVSNLLWGKGISLEVSDKSSGHGGPSTGNPTCGIFINRKGESGVVIDPPNRIISVDSGYQEVCGVRRVLFKPHVLIFHEMHHHLTRCLESQAFVEDICVIAEELKKVGFPDSYTAELKKCWTNGREFRNITSVFLVENPKGVYTFFCDPLSEAAFLFEEKHLRGSHCPKEDVVVPIALVDMLEKAGKVIIGGDYSLFDRGELTGSWS